MSESIIISVSIDRDGEGRVCESKSLAYEVSGDNAGDAWALEQLFQSVLDEYEVGKFTATVAVRKPYG